MGRGYLIYTCFVIPYQKREANRPLFFCADDRTRLLFVLRTNLWCCRRRDRRQADAHRASAFRWVRVYPPHKQKKDTPLECLSFVGADDRTRTCTLARWNLNPMSLPIPPHPRISSDFYTGRKPGVGPQPDPRGYFITEKRDCQSKVEPCKHGSGNSQLLPPVSHANCTNFFPFHP